MTQGKWLLVGAFLITVLSTCIALVFSRNNATESARLARSRTIGVGIWAFIIPAWLFLEEPLGSRGAVGALTYIAVLAVIVGGGMIMFLRGRGFHRWP